LETKRLRLTENQQRADYTVQEGMVDVVRRREDFTLINNTVRHRGEPHGLGGGSYVTLVLMMT